MLSAEKQVSYKPWIPSVASEKAPPVHIGERVAHELGARVRDAAQSLPRRGLEIGGLLLGSTGTDGIYVEWFAPIESEYPDGPCFRVPEPSLLAAIERAQQHARVVGIYRSRTDHTLELDEQDYFLLRRLSDATSPLGIFMFLVSATAPPAGRVGLWENSRERWLGPAQPWQVWLTGSEPEAAAATPAVAAISPASEPETLALLPRDEESGLIAVPQAAGARLGPKLAAGVSVIALGSFLWIALRDPSPAPSPADQDAAASSQRSRTPDPLPEQFGRPGIIPPPGERPSPFGQPAQPWPAPQPPANAARLPDSQPRTSPKTKFQIPPARAVAGAQEQQLNPGPAPSISAGLSNTVPGQPSLPITIPADIPAREPGTNSAIEFTPPVLARQAGAVVVPPDIRRLLQHEVLLELKVKVNENGNVTDVSALRALDRTGQTLLRTYSSAVSAWTFEPGRRNGQPVPAEIILRFRVQPAN